MSANCEIIVSQTYFWQGRPVTVMRVIEGMALVRAGNSNKRLDFWVTWSELT